MAERPFFKKTIEELEQMYALNRDDAKMVKHLLRELKHRKTQRAQKLKALIVEGDKPPLWNTPADPALYSSDDFNKAMDSWDALVKKFTRSKH